MPSLEGQKKIIYRRRFPRRQMRNPVGILAQGIYQVVPGSEVGEGGLLFQAEASIAIGSDVVVNFYVPGRNFITIRAQILYARPLPASQLKSYGVKFHHLPFEGRRMIRDYIADKTANEDIF